jgi:hypothetical protein
MPLISQSIPVAIGSDRPKKGEREMSIGKERWERNPEGGGNHVTQIFYISVNSSNQFFSRTEGGKRDKCW